MSDTQADYLGATGRDLDARTATDRLRARLDAGALFPRRGRLRLFANRLVLGGWARGADVTVHPSELVSVGADDLRSFAGNPRRPIVLRLVDGDTLYLLVNHRRLLARNDNVLWTALLADWLAAHR